MIKCEVWADRQTHCSDILSPTTSFDLDSPTPVPTTNNVPPPPAGETPNGSAVGFPKEPTTQVTVISSAAITKSPTTSIDSAGLATQTPTSPTLQSANASGKSDGVSKGAVAGIAIGTAIIGAAIAFLVAFLLFKRRRRSRPHTGSGYESNPELMSLAKAGQMSHVREMSQTHLPTPIIAAAAIPPRQDVDLTSPDTPDFLAGVLPPPADDQTVREKVASLFDQIQLHVENFYRDVHASITPSMETGLSRFGNGGEGVAEMLQNSSRPTVVLKHALMGYVLGITSPAGGTDVALFPKDVTGIRDGEQFKGDSDLSAAYALYKRLAVHLHSSTPPPPSRKSDILEAAEHFSLTFFPWANPRYGDQEQDENLVQIINSALELSIWLYGEPASYEFRWEGVGRRGIVLAPGLTKMDDGSGRQPQMLLEPVVVPT
ncbi:hypothetical protein BCR34DRAFT_304179 [Clohesyomyces aquaticus]|uniref:Uncharacterized protein n=1 Tax=Clohesyomyces aquaticus TaxID=1231657 RepID=A0A1Y1ZQ40_9PLEO|nr:hypothetical protein BCR34DRAFT_304179 [Clohesyomyces aquaticus]